MIGTRAGDPSAVAGTNHCLPRLGSEEIVRDGIQSVDGDQLWYGSAGGELLRENVSCHCSMQS